MSDRSRTCEPMTSEATSNTTSSPAAASGLPHCAKSDGKTTGQSGPGVVPASPSAKRVRASASTTPAISGPTGFGSLASAGLTRFLVSRLQARASGSILYALTWKVSATPSGQLIYRLRASPRARTSASDLTGWPTATTPSGGQTWPEGTSGTGRRPDGSKATVTLEQVGRLAGWGTATATDRYRDEETMAKCAAFRKRNANQNSVPLYLGEEAWLAGWATTTTRDWRSDRSRLTAEALYGSKGQPLARQVLYADATGSSVRTAASGLLRPGHSRWLLRLPAAWEPCVSTAMASISRKR